MSIKHNQPGTASWSYIFHSAGLASAMACDGQQQQNHFVRPSAGDRESSKE